MYAQCTCVNTNTVLFAICVHFTRAVFAFVNDMWMTRPGCSDFSHPQPVELQAPILARLCSPFRLPWKIIRNLFEKPSILEFCFPTKSAWSFPSEINLWWAWKGLTSCMTVRFQSKRQAGVAKFVPAEVLTPCFVHCLLPKAFRRLGPWAAKSVVRG